MIEIYTLIMTWVQIVLKTKQLKSANYTFAEIILKINYKQM